MNERSIDASQRFAARLAGCTYLANYITAVFGVIVTSSIAGSGDFAERAARIAGSAFLYRTALASTTISWLLIVVLAFALYVTLEPVNKRLAQLALFFEIGQASVGAVTVLFSFANLRLYTAAHATASAPSDQIQALAKAIATAADSGFNITMMFLAVGSTLFFCLFYTSGYIPKALAGLGVFGSALMLAVSVAMLLFPEYERTLQLGWAPIGVAEITTAFWLAIVGIRQRRLAAGTGAPA
jgi:hypothetical protein